MRRLLTTVIFSFWAVMMVLLVRRTWLAAPSDGVGSERLTPAAGAEEEEWMSVYYQRQKIGYTHHRFAADPRGFAYAEESLLRLTVLGKAQTVRTRIGGHVNADFALRDVDFDLSSGVGNLHAGGVVQGAELLLTLRTGSDVSEQRLPLDEPLYLASTFRATLRAGALQPGRQLEAMVFDPMTLKNDRVRLTVEAQEIVPQLPASPMAWRVREEFRGLKTTAWIDTTGGVLREEGPMGFVLRRETADEALNRGWETSTALDLVATAAVPVARPIEEPRTRRSLRLRLSGIALDGVPSDEEQIRQGAILTIHRATVDSLASYALPYRDAAHASDVLPTSFLQSDHPRLRGLARDIAGDERDAKRVAVRLNDWVYTHLRKVPTISIPNALQVLDMGEGDCNEHAVLLAALARAAGLPARLIAGAVYVDGAFFYHAWCEVWLDRWVSIDPALHQFPADATHIKFVVGGPDEQLAMLNIIGQLGVEVLDDAPEGPRE